MADAMTERELRLAIVTAASYNDWLWSYNPDSRRVQGDPGLPDLILARGGVTLAIELKTNAGRFRDGQRRWAEAMGADLYAAVRADDLDRILRRLR